MRRILFLKFYIVLFISLIFILLLGDFYLFAESTKTTDVTSSIFDNESKIDLGAISTHKFFFGHHSVGENIIHGIEKLDSESSAFHLNIVETLQPLPAASAGYFAHGATGHNFDPLSKINAFKQVMESGMGDNVDVAFMKFCFVDIGTQTDVSALFATYKDIMAQLKREYPHVTFVHVTVPLVVEPQGIKSLVKQKLKSLLGKNDFYENTAKYRYNRLLRDEYSGKEPIFDLAGFESTYPDGRRLTYRKDGIEYEALIPEYSSDGGHLNDQGQKILAGALLTFLAKLK